MIILDFPGGPNVIMGPYKRGKKDQGHRRRCDDGSRGHEPRNADGL